MLSVHGLAKRYGKAMALRGVSFELTAGTFNGLLGPNGAGKSTLFQVLTGLFSADEGDVNVAGHSLRHAPTRALRHIGVVFQQMSLDLDLSIRRNLWMHADLHGLPHRVANARIDAGCAQLGIGADLMQPVRELSGGNRRKVELVRALLHRPQVLLMDEATVGLDPQSRHDLLTALHADVRERGTCVLWATHRIEEAAQAHRVLVLHKGALLADGTPQDVTEQLNGPMHEDAFMQRNGSALEDAFVRATRPAEAASS